MVKPEDIMYAQSMTELRMICHKLIEERETLQREAFEAGFYNAGSCWSDEYGVIDEAFNEWIKERNE